MAVNPSPSPRPTPDDGRLACGRDAALLWDRAADGGLPDEHEREW